MDSVHCANDFGPNLKDDYELPVRTLFDCNSPEVLMHAIRRGYIHLLDTEQCREVGMFIWLDAWKKLVIESGKGVTSTQQLFDKVGNDPLLVLWRDDLLLALRQLGPCNKAAEDGLALCDAFVERFVDEPVERLIEVACTAADLSWNVREPAAAEARYVAILKRWPRRRQPMLRHIEAALICPLRGIERDHCLGLLAELAAVQQFRGLDWREHDGVELEQELSYLLTHVLTHAGVRSLGHPYIDCFAMSGWCMIEDRGIDLEGLGWGTEPA